METVTPSAGPSAERTARWQPLSSLERRVLGVLVEKAKTTPDQYPMSLNALRTGCNQKTNRYPLMEVDEDDIQAALDRLKLTGAVTEVIGGGRVARFRHHAYEWFGVDKVELAVMAELLLRGAQSEGELRGRAARMEPIADLAALRPVLASLKAKGLVLALSPEGRGHQVSHALYQPRELEKVKAEAGLAAASLVDEDATEAAPSRPTSAAMPRPATALAADVPARAPESGQLRAEVDSLRHELATMRQTIAQLGELVEQAQREVRELRSSLGG